MRRIAFAVLLGISTVVCGRAETAGPASPGLLTAPPRTISADLRIEKGPLNPMFRECVGAGRANEGLRADWQRQLAYVRRECGFKYLRMHGLLCDDMGVYMEDAKGRPVYNWQYVDELYDYLLSIGMKPFVELGFMPAALAKGTQTIFWWRGNTTLPKDWQKWENLIRATVDHWTRRYGETEVKSWFFEVWNEPNLHGFFDGTQDDYFKLYDVTARAIKSVNPDYKVGGPATAGVAWVPEFIAFCTAKKAPVDFISTHTYAVSQGFLDESGHDGTVFSPNPRSIFGEVIDVRKQIQASARPDLALHLTEWSASYTPSDPIHDSYHSASFIVDRLRRAGNAADSMSYWVFTDIFEEAGPRTTPFHGGFGLVNYQGINKPAFYAYQFLNRLGPVELQCDADSAWVTTDGKGAVQALIWDFTYTHPGKSAINQEFYTRDLPPSKVTPTTLTIRNLKPGRYAIRVFKVGYRVNDAYATYRDLGAPSQLTREQVAYIKSLNDGAPVEQSLVTVGADGVYSRPYEIRENDLCLVQIDPLEPQG
jgi:xylan 1,4-beta-xylosidase